jgi:hypothetical protein
VFAARYELDLLNVIKVNFRVQRFDAAVFCYSVLWCLVMKGKGFARQRRGITEILFQHSYGETDVNHEELSWYPCRDSNLTPAEYKSRAISLHQLAQLFGRRLTNRTAFPSTPAGSSLHDSAVLPSRRPYSNAGPLLGIPLYVIDQEMICCW